MSHASPSVAVIGGGISGLVCAARLGQLGINNVTVFDTGKHAAGGRCSSRDIIINGQVHRFDHSAQYFTVSDPRFAKIVSFLHKNNAIRVWNGPIGHIGRSAKFQRNPTTKQCFIGTDGMRSIPECLGSLVNMKRPVWISRVNWESSMKKWRVESEGFFDYLVIAHNGKCADRLMADSGAPEIHSLLKVRFSDRVSPKDRTMTLSSLWVLMVAFPKSLKLAFEGAHVDNDPDLSWVANNTAKLKNGKSLTQQTLKQITECWTIISTKEFGKANKVPQEMIPPKKGAEVTDKLLTAFARVTGAKKDLLKPSYTQVQLWGAAVPLNTIRSKDRCLFDGFRNVGVCGDWLGSGGPSIQGAALSGLDLAESICKQASGAGKGSSFSPDFMPVCDSNIGSFPSDASIVFNPQK